MKQIYLLAILLLSSFLMQGQSVLHYDFNHSLSEANGNGPTLSVLGDNGIYVEDTLLEIGSAQKWVYRFEANSGFQFDNAAAGNFLGENYTIELYFVFDELNSWKRVVDWKNRKTDYGAYVFNGKLNFYPHAYSGEAPVVEGEYTYYVITRNAGNEELIIYADAVTHITLTDSPGDALLDEENVLNFFHDDLVVQNEASSGAVAMLKLYNYTLDSATIKQKYDDLAGSVFYIGERNKENTIVRTYPNPVRDRFTIDLGNFDQKEGVSIRLVNVLGMTVRQLEVEPAKQQQIDIDVQELRNGVYALIAESNSRVAIQKILINR